MTDQLAALRAEVEALRDEERSTDTESSSDYDAGESFGREQAYSRVLDLIDEHAREGQ